MRRAVAIEANFSPAAIAGNCHFNSSPKGERAGKLPSRTAPLASGQESSRALPLLGENKNLCFTFESQFQHAAVFVRNNHRVG